MANLFADLHVHPTLYGFNRMRNDPAAEGDPDRFHPWHVLPSNLKKQGRGDRGSTYSQASIPKLAAAGCRLVFASITPIEKGFFDGRLAGGGPFALEVLKWVTGAVPALSAYRLARSDTAGALREFTSILRNRGPLRQFVQSLFLRYHGGRVRFLMSGEFDYWREFELETDYYLSRNGQRCQATFELPGPNGPENRSVEGTYHLIKDTEQLREVIEGEGDDLAIIMTIEGAHTLTIGPDLRRVPEPVLFDRIAALKNFEHPVFFITLAHHFDNGFCGHARSVPDAAMLVMDQTERVNEGLETENDLGVRVIRSFLGLDDELKDTDEGRILVDCKHMSARARREYYEQVVTPYNEGPETDRPRLPVIFSHAAYSGVRTLDEMIANLEFEDDHWRAREYCAWNLNICDDDVRMVHATGGLIGLVFDQRVLGRRHRGQLSDNELPHLLLRHVFAVADVIMNDDRIGADDKRRIWDCLCLGTDYDGLIDPVATYATALSLPRFAEDLARELQAESHTRQIASIGVGEIVEKIAWRNAYDFARRHLPFSARKK
jgi:hypothetical protein